MISGIKIKNQAQTNYNKNINILTDAASSSYTSYDESTLIISLFVLTIPFIPSRDISQSTNFISAELLTENVITFEFVHLSIVFHSLSSLLIILKPLFLS